MCLYQFLVAVRSDGSLLQTADGETTRYKREKGRGKEGMNWLQSSHGHFLSYHSNDRQWNQTGEWMISTCYTPSRHHISFCNIVSQVYVFDGKPPDMKSGELEKRAQRREGERRSLFVDEISSSFIILIPVFQTLRSSWRRQRRREMQRISRSELTFFFFFFLRWTELIGDVQIRTSSSQGHEESQRWGLLRLHWIDIHALPAGEAIAPSNGNSRGGGSLWGRGTMCRVGQQWKGERRRREGESQSILLRCTVQRQRIWTLSPSDQMSSLGLLSSILW